MAEKLAKSQVESVAAEEENTLATRERNLPSYLSDYTDVPDDKAPDDKEQKEIDEN